MSATAERLNAAAAHLRAGRLAAARETLAALPAEEARRPDALHLMGVVALQSGQPSTAVDLLRRAVGADGLQAHYRSNLGLAWRALKRDAESAAELRRAVALRPDGADYLANLAAALHALGRLPAAAGLLGRAVRLAPGHGSANAALGAVLGDLGRPQDALTALDAALACAPLLAEAHYNRGGALRALDRHADAAAGYRRALALQPAHADALNNLGITLRALDRPAVAAALLRRVLRLRPDDVEVLNNLGNALHDAGALDEAASTLGRVVAAQANAAGNDDPAVLSDHGVRLRAAGRPAEAAGLLCRAVALRPDHPNAYGNLGPTLRALGDAAAAARQLRRALALSPAFAQAHYNLGNVFLAGERYGDAAARFRAALALNPGDSSALNNLGVAARESGDPRRAADAFARATRLRGAEAGGVANLGAAMLDLGELDGAAARLAQAARLDPACAEARKNLGMTLLLRGDLEPGWAEYEHRWDTADFRRRAFPQSRWRGEGIAGRTILVYAEQGLGDTLQFVRYVPLLAARGARVVLEAPRVLHRLLSTLLGGATLIGVGEPPPDFDVHCPLLSLPLAFGTRLETVPAAVPYLAAEPARIAHWRERLPKAPLRVGIVWQGNPAAKVDRGRSPPLSCFVPLARVPGVALVSLQKNHGLDQLSALPPDVTVHTLGEDFDSGPDAFLDTAAVMENLDLIVTSDTSVAHLAGALGRPTWLALKAVPDWRWLMERSDSPWYPSMRLFRQETPGDWGPVFARMAAELPALSPAAAGADALRRLLALDPCAAEARSDLGMLAGKAGDAPRAAALLRQTVAVRPDWADAHNNAGIALRAVGQPDAARASLRRALLLAPDHAEAPCHIGNAELAAGRPAPAAAAFRRAIAARPGFAAAYNNLGHTLLELSDVAAAVTTLERARCLQSGDAGVAANLAAAMHGLGRLDAAADAYRAAVDADPANAAARTNLGITLLLRGDLEAGWREYEHRWNLPEFRRPPLTQPLWRGEDPAGRTILVHAEQGLGDVLQFARYLPLLAERGARVIFAAPRILHALLATLPGPVRLADPDAALPEADLQCPLLSLPLAFGTRLDTIPAQVPYLAAEPGRAAAWRGRLPDARLRIGIAWQGKPTAKVDRGRSPPLSCFVPLARVPGVALVNLQKNHGLDQLSALPPDVTVHTLGEDFDSGPDAFLDTAAVMESLGLIVTSDTSIAHLAGALGRPTWLALKAVPDWRWLMERSDSPWYPGMRLFRQETPGGWTPVFARMAAGLRMAGRRSAETGSFEPAAQGPSN